MSNLLEQGAKPRSQYTARKKRGPYGKQKNKKIGKRAVPRPQVDQPSDPTIRYLALTQGKVAVVDAEDFARANALNWHAVRSVTTFYAQCGAFFYPNGRQRFVSLQNFILPPPDNLVVDHINGDGLDNRKCNLRFATGKQNARNKRLGRNSTTGYIGVTFDKRGRMFVAQLTCDGKHYREWHRDAVGAAKARDALALKYHGEFAILNFPKK